MREDERVTTGGPPGTEWDPAGPNLVYLADNAVVLPNLPDGTFRMIYIDPPFNTGRQQSCRPCAPSAAIGGDRIGFRGQAYDTVAPGRIGYDDIFDDYWAFLTPRLERGLAAARRRRHAVPAPGLPRGPLRQGLPRRTVRPGLLPQRDHLGLRLRRPGEEALADQARQHPGLREGPDALPLRRRRGRPRAVHGARSGHPGEGRPREAADRRVVAHDRHAHRQGEDRLPDPEARGHPAPDGRGQFPRPATGCPTSSPAAAHSARSPSAWVEVRAGRLERRGPGGRGQASAPERPTPLSGTWIRAGWPFPSERAN